MLNKKEFINVVSGTTGKSKKEVESAVDWCLKVSSMPTSIMMV